MPTNQLRKPIEIKISTIVAVAATLHDTEIDALNLAMHEVTGNAPDYFDGEFAIIDVGALSAPQAAIDWNALIQLFKSFRLNLVAVRNAPPAMEPEISAHGLSLDVLTAVPKTSTSPLPAPEPAAPVIQQANALIIDTPVRAGQRIYARDSDLIITAAVNNGAEVIADGSIHVYATLRGRALAGARGNSNARIFALGMAPELISIAGIYRTFEDGLPKEFTLGPTQVRLSGERLEMVPFNPIK